MLSSLLDHRAADAEDGGLVALAYHAHASAMRALTGRAGPSHSFKEREHALFWLGQTRGEEARAVLARSFRIAAGHGVFRRSVEVRR